MECTQFVIVVYFVFMPRVAFAWRLTMLSMPAWIINIFTLRFEPWRLHVNGVRDVLCTLVKRSVLFDCYTMLRSVQESSLLWFKGKINFHWKIFYETFRLVHIMLIKDELNYVYARASEAQIHSIWVPGETFSSKIIHSRQFSWAVYLPQ